MKTKPCLSLVILLAFLFSSSAFAQGQGGSNVLRIRGFDLKRQQTPEYDVRGPSFPSADKKNWSQVQVDFDTAPEWIDQLDFTYYVVVRSEASPNGFLLFRENISYVNIERGRHQSVMYMHPSTVDRFGKVERMAVLVRMNGQLVGMASEPESRQRWWEQLTPVTGYLLNRLDTPFAMINYDNYPAIKPSNRN